MDCNAQAPLSMGFSMQWIFLEWIAFSFSRESSQTRDHTCITCIDRWIPYHWTTREALINFFLKLYFVLVYRRLTGSVIVSGGQRRDSWIHIHVSILPLYLINIYWMNLMLLLKETVKKWFPCSRGSWYVCQSSVKMSWGLQSTVQGPAGAGPPLGFLQFALQIF